MHELYKDLHQHRNKDKQGSWVCKKSEMKLVMFVYYVNLQNNASLSVLCIWLDIMHAQHIETKWFTCFLQVEHTQKWEQFRNTQPSTENMTNEDPILERDF